MAQEYRGLERSCAGFLRDRIISAPALPGIERIEARFSGEVFALHRHDTYAIGVTLHGVQTFRYRGETWYSTPGKIIVLHPDEAHDGGAGTAAGLRYRMLYLEPSLLAQSLSETHAVLPFVGRPIVIDDALRAVLLTALASLDTGLEELFVADLVSEIAGGLLRLAGSPHRRIGHIAWRQVHAARVFIEANATRAIGSDELERVSGLDRYELARHFRRALATSPHRFQVMRRLQIARRMIGTGEPLAQIAAASGFADQSHLTRHFKKAFGLTPGRWADLVQAGGRD